MYYLTTLIAKALNGIIKLLNIGEGVTWPGYVALKVYPQLLRDKKIKLKKGIVLISGTNGKTTTSTLITHLVKNSGYKVLHNKSGANLLSGIVSCLLLDTNIWGCNRSDLAVFEVDEFTLPILLQNLQPSVLALLNLSRDQLDRYGETDIILDKWLEAIKKLTPRTALVLDSTQSNLSVLAENFPHRTFYFDANPEYLSKTKLVGEFNAKNVNAALAVCTVLGLDHEKILKSLSTFDAAYGRGERLGYGFQEYQILLTKNPASFDNNLILLTSGILSPDAFLLVLNDLIPDGRDISWIYDINPEILAQAFSHKKVFISGTRANEMAQRLVYAGVHVEEKNVNTDLASMMKSISKQEDISTVLALPNYSAMLNVRKIITGKKML